jgi:hypothetical protein
MGNLVAAREMPFFEGRLPRSARRARQNAIDRNCSALNSQRPADHSKVVRWNKHQKYLASLASKKQAGKIVVRQTADRIFGEDHSIKTGVKAFPLEVSHDRLIVRDGQTNLVHGQLLVASTPTFHIKSAAGDHGCGAASFRIPSGSDISLIQRRMATLPTGGRVWVPSIRNRGDLSRFNGLKFPDRLEKDVLMLNPSRFAGSLGSGNHFCHIVQKGSERRLVVHTGSRGVLSKLTDPMVRHYGSAYSEEYGQLLRTCERWAQLNRDTIANYLITGRLTDSPDILSGVHYPHTRLDDMMPSRPVIQKNVTRHKKKTKAEPFRDLVLGSPRSSVTFVDAPGPYVVHGTGPDPEQKGGFLPAPSLGGDVWESVYNFDRHVSAGGTTFIN